MYYGHTAGNSSAYLHGSPSAVVEYLGRTPRSFFSCKQIRLVAYLLGGINREYVIETIVRPSIGLSGDFECLNLFSFIEI